MLLTRTGDLDSRQSLVRFDQEKSQYISVNLYICMQYCQGENLQRFIEKRQKPNARENLSIFRQLVGGVSSIHDLQIVHRDLKPQNVFMTGPDNQVRIGDFGLAVHHVEEFINNKNSTAESGCAGTARYMPPELSAQKEAGDSKSDKSLESQKMWDIYALGIILSDLVCNPVTAME